MFMRNKRMAALMAAGAVVCMLTGCGNAGESSGTDVSETQTEVSDAEAAKVAESAEEAKTGTDEAGEENSDQDTIEGADADTVQDASAQIRHTATAGSLEEFYGKYHVQGASGVYYYFDGESTSYYVQTGEYELEHGVNTSDEGADMVLITFDATESQDQYTIETTDGLQLVTTQDGADHQTVFELELLDGTDGLTDFDGEEFEGIYAVEGNDTYRFEFHRDGTFYLVMENEYSVEGDEITFESFGYELTYTYEAADGVINLTSEGQLIAVLEPSD